MAKPGEYDHLNDGNFLSATFSLHQIAERIMQANYGIPRLLSILHDMYVEAAKKERDQITRDKLIRRAEALRTAIAVF